MRKDGTFIDADTKVVYRNWEEVEKKLSGVAIIDDIPDNEEISEGGAEWLRISDERMIEALITTESITKCAEVLGCNRKSIYDRFRNYAYWNYLFINGIVDL